MNARGLCGLSGMLCASGTVTWAYVFAAEGDLVFLVLAVTYALAGFWSMSEWSKS